MTNIAKYEGKAQDLWANKDVRANLKPFINKKYAEIDSKSGAVVAGPSKRSCLSKLIHNILMKFSSSYQNKKVNAAIQAYNVSVDKINKKAASILVKDLQAKIEVEEKIILNADAQILEQTQAKTLLEQPIKNEEANKENFINALKDVGILFDTIDVINGQNYQLKALDDQVQVLDAETLALNVDTKDREAKYPFATWGIKGIWYFNVKNDKDASIQKIKNEGYSADQTEALTADVCRVIENNNRLAEITAKNQELSNLKKDILAIQTPLIQDIVAKLVANNLSTLSDVDSINSQIEALDKNIADKKAELSPQFEAIVSQIQTANGIKSQANAEIAKLRTSQV